MPQGLLNFPEYPPDPDASRLLDKLSEIMTYSSRTGDQVYNNNISADQLRGGAINSLALRMLRDKLHGGFGSFMKDVEAPDDVFNGAYDLAEELVDIIQGSSAFDHFSPEEKRSYIQQMISRFQSERTD